MFFTSKVIQIRKLSLQIMLLGLLAVPVAYVIGWTSCSQASTVIFVFYFEVFIAVTMKSAEGNF